MKRTAVFLATMFFTSVALYAEVPRSRRDSTIKYFDPGLSGKTEESERRGKSITPLEKGVAVLPRASTIQHFNPGLSRKAAHSQRRGKPITAADRTPAEILQEIYDSGKMPPSPNDFDQLAMLPAPVIEQAINFPPAEKAANLEPVQLIESTEVPAELGPADIETAKIVLAKQKTLTPTLEDGVNDEAVFGPDAKEVTIRDATERTVFHARRVGEPVLRWDCRGPAGKVVEQGVYSVVVLSQDSKEFRQSFIVLR